MSDAYYEIEKNGHPYFGNVSLNEHHQFRQDGEHYLFNTATMTPYKISESVARLVEKAASSSGGVLISEQDMAELKKLGLVVGIDRQPSPCLDTPKSTAAQITSTANPVKVRHAVGAIALFVAQECNMGCVYCYGQGGEYGNKGMMHATTACKSVDWLLDNSGDMESVHISFFGGEPLMNFPLIKQVVNYAKLEAEKRGKKVTFGLITNGSVLSDQHIAFLRDENITPAVSFDGSPAIQNRQRPFKNGKNSYDVTWVNIQKLKKVFPNVMARATRYGDTDPAEMRAGLKEAGFEKFIIQNASPVILDNPSREGVSCPEQGQADERMMNLEQSLAYDLLNDIKARNLGPGATNGRVAAFLGQFIAGNKRHYHCGVGKGLAAISTTGDIYPCHRFVGQQDMKIGNIDSYTVDGINNYHRAVVDNLPECKTCWARYTCGGGCFYDNKASRGATHLPDRSFCQEVYATMEMAITLYLQLDDEDKRYFHDSLKH